MEDPITTAIQNPLIKIMEKSMVLNCQLPEILHLHQELKNSIMSDKEQAAERSAFEHTVFMTLADIQYELNPDVEKEVYLDRLLKMKREQKAMILNQFKLDQN